MIELIQTALLRGKEKVAAERQQLLQKQAAASTSPIDDLDKEASDLIAFYEQLAGETKSASDVGNIPTDKDKPTEQSQQTVQVPPKSLPSASEMNTTPPTDKDKPTETPNKVLATQKTGSIDSIPLFQAIYNIVSSEGSPDPTKIATDLNIEPAVVSELIFNITGKKAEPVLTDTTRVGENVSQEGGTPKTSEEMPKEGPGPVNVNIPFLDSNEAAQAFTARQARAVSSEKDLRTIFGPDYTDPGDDAAKILGQLPQ